MKRFLKKRWHRIPVGIAMVLMALILAAGSAFAAFSFWSATATVGVVEAIAVGAGTWDNLSPYGSVDDVDIVFGEDTITITTAADTSFVGEGFAPGEWIVIPLNIRNGSDAELTLSASVRSDGLGVTASYELNKGAETDPIPAGHEGAFLAYGFEAQGVFGPLSGWVETVAGNSGFSGSAVHNAQVLFVKITAPGDIAPGTYTVEITLERS